MGRKKDPDKKWVDRKDKITRIFTMTNTKVTFVNIAKEQIEHLYIEIPEPFSLKRFDLFFPYTGNDNIKILDIEQISKRKILRTMSIKDFIDNSVIEAEVNK